MEKNQNDKKFCEQCQKWGSASNFKRHKADCDRKHEENNVVLNLQNALDRALEENKSLIEKNNQLQEKLEEVVNENYLLRDTLSCFQTKISSVLGGCASKIPLNYDALIEREFEQDKLINYYKGEWNTYSTWCKSNGKEFLDVDSGNEYIKSIEMHTTAHKKRGIIQSLLTLFLRKDILLKPAKGKIPKREKYAMNIEDLSKYFSEQEKKNFDLFFVQYFLFYFCARVNSIYHLQFKHLLFLKNENNLLMRLPDHKKKIKEETVPVEIEFVQKFKDFLGTRQRNDDDYVFFPTIKFREAIGRKINVAIGESKVMKELKEQYPTKVFSVHMFRKATPCEAFHQKKHEGYADARKLLRQALGTNSVNYYIVGNTN